MGRQPHILAVEDHKPLRAAIKDILEAEGYAITTASDGVEALEVMEHTQPDLVLADIMMPRMDGYALYDAVRARPEWVPIPFIFLSAKAEREDVLRGKGLGAEDYLTKPFDPQELVVAVRARLGRAEAIRGATQAEFDELKQQIVAALGHELRTPLTYVTGYADVALEDIRSLPPDELQEFLLGIKRGADRLTRLVEDLLLLVQLDSGRLDEDMRRLAHVHDDLAAIIERVIQRYQQQAATRGVTLATGLSPDLPAVELCESFFADALGRMVDNGIKFSPRGMGRQVTVEACETDGWVEVTVRDEGVGIAESDIPHLFERFRQFGRQEMEQQGTGLGLAIAHGMVRLHGGDITVESEHGRGSNFTIRLKARDDG